LVIFAHRPEWLYGAMPTDFNIVLSAHQVSRDLGGEVVILNIDQGVYYGLGSVGSRVWNLLYQPRKFSEICRVIVTEYDVEPSSCEADLHDLIERLQSQGLIEIVP
jgi:Coenzyme PQQ synthesis protein D (PqqD)